MKRPLKQQAEAGDDHGENDHGSDDDVLQVGACGQSQRRQDRHQHGGGQKRRQPDQPVNSALKWPTSRRAGVTGQVVGAYQVAADVRRQHVAEKEAGEGIRQQVGEGNADTLGTQKDAPLEVAGGDRSQIEEQRRPAAGAKLAPAIRSCHVSQMDAAAARSDQARR